MTKTSCVFEKTHKWSTKGKNAFLTTHERCNKCKDEDSKAYNACLASSFKSFNPARNFADYIIFVNQKEPNDKPEVVKVPIPQKVKQEQPV